MEAQTPTFGPRLALDRFRYAEAQDTLELRRSQRHKLSQPTWSPPESSPKRKRTSSSHPSAHTEAVRPDPSARLSQTKEEAHGQTVPRKKKLRSAGGYAPPSTYAHLPLLPDALAPNLLVLFVGLNPGIQTARSGHAYAHPSNLFWKLLFSSGITPRLCRPHEDRDMPALYSLGHTNIVARPSRSGAELSSRELDNGVGVLEDKIRACRPEVVCIVGKGIWESIWRVRHGRPLGSKFCYGWQDDSENMGTIDDKWPGARVFVATSTSGLAASLSPAEKQAIWAQLGSWTKARRAERRKQEARQEGPEKTL
ncbi:hypothetical protein CDD82_772 [Ophiocordyceps australis]|uniref:Uracil-DNA glycosylase-like domain-containing protein n=1 Tax=Ophiocordyceps australis TaxID=1399860 RepID=A0A2C5ZTW9_9HYPO|nr:hypothetical protein CDD82_772 [Ophiocordyceps australis]